MTWVDLAIVVVIAAAVVGGMMQGFLRTACSVIGLVFGLALALWNYAQLGMVFRPIVHVEAIANAIAFLIIALAVMALANLVGLMLKRTVSWMGLGCLDKVAGAIFGFFQGALLVTLCILVTVAFFPGARWPAEARLPQYFVGALHLSMHMSSAELSDKVRNGLRRLEHDSPHWTHP
jgi:membrane protein required for colicin V production